MIFSKLKTEVFLFRPYEWFRYGAPFYYKTPIMWYNKIDFYFVISKNRFCDIKKTLCDSAKKRFLMSQIRFYDIIQLIS